VVHPVRKAVHEQGAMLGFIKCNNASGPGKIRLVYLLRKTHLCAKHDAPLSKS